MMTTWRYYFDVAVIFLSILAIFVALALIGTWAGRFRAGSSGP
jgi:hypothetical protein